MNAASVTPAQSADSTENISGKIAGLLKSDGMSAGDRAELRRSATSPIVQPVFYRMWCGHLRLEPPGLEVALRWQTLAALLAEIPAKAKARFGAALANAGFTELRLARLAGETDPAARRQLTMRAVKFMAAHQAGCSPWSLKDWLFAVSSADMASRAEELTHDYYTALLHAGRI